MREEYQEALEILFSKKEIKDPDLWYLIDLLPNLSVEQINKIIKDSNDKIKAIYCPPLVNGNCYHLISCVYGVWSYDGVGIPISRDDKKGEIDAIDFAHNNWGNDLLGCAGGIFSETIKSGFEINNSQYFLSLGLLSLDESDSLSVLEFECNNIV